MNNAYQRDEVLTVRPDLTADEMEAFGWDWNRRAVDMFLALKGQRLVAIKRYGDLINVGEESSRDRHHPDMFLSTWSVPDHFLVPFKLNDVTLEVDHV